MTMEGEEETESIEDVLKAPIAIRCAKAAFLLSSLKSRRIHQPDFKDEESERLRRITADLRTELVRERFKNRKMRLCSLVESILQILVLLSFVTFCLIVGSV